MFALWYTEGRHRAYGPVTVITFDTDNFTPIRSHLLSTPPSFLATLRDNIFRGFVAIVKKTSIIVWNNPYLLSAVGLLATFSICKYMVVFQPDYCRYLTSLFIRKTGKFYVKPEIFRSTFNDTPLMKLNDAGNHTHGQSAASRSSASLFCEGYAASLGKRAFFVQSSRADQRHKRLGNRNYYWAKDLTAEPTWSTPSPDNVVAIVDVDEYMEMEEMLAYNENALILYTFVPHAAADVQPDFSFTFDKSSRVHYTVSGGGTYVHEVWNYNHDHITCQYKVFGIPIRTTSYLIDRKPAGVHHELIHFAPVASWGLLSSIVFQFLFTDTLQRYDVIRAEHIRLRIQTLNKHEVSTAIPMQYACATVPVEVDDHIITLARIVKGEVQLASIESILGSPTVDAEEQLKRKRTSAILKSYTERLANYFSNTSTIVGSIINRLMMINSSSIFRPESVYPPNASLARYQFGHFDQSAKPSMEPYMNPIMTGAFAPDRTQANEEQAVTGRIKAVANNTEATPFVRKCMHEFVECIFPRPHELVPTSYEYVGEMQNRPTQRSLFLHAMYSMPRRIIKFFMKAEAYSKPSDPRIISTFNSTDKVDYSRFTYALADYIKDNHSWYAFGTTPKVGAEKIAALCAGATSIIKTDFHRLDGTISPALRELERCLWLRGFSQIHLEELVALHKAQYNLPAVGTFGTKYNSGTARGSGSPETSILNSIDNCFCTYLAHRMTRVNGVFLEKEDAWERTKQNAFGGDDGAVKDMPVDKFEEAAKAIGLSASVEPVLRGNFGVAFLSRQYTRDVWTGDPSSCCDLKRILPKLHITTIKNNVPPVQRLLEKCYGFSLSDANTPIIGQIACKTRELAPNFQPEFEYWNSDVPIGDQFPNSNIQAIRDLVEWQFGPDVWIEEAKLVAYLSSCNTPEDLLHMPLLFERPTLVRASQDVTISGDIVYARSEKRSSPTSGKHAPAIPPRPTASAKNKGPAIPPRPAVKQDNHQQRRKMKFGNVNTKVSIALTPKG
jgi:hypothetical protein